MTETILTLLLLLVPAVQNRSGDAKQLITNNRVTVLRIDDGASPIGSADHDVVMIDLDAKNASFLPKGSRRAGPKHAVVVELFARLPSQKMQGA